jgi:hypothetical protein
MSLIPLNDLLVYVNAADFEGDNSVLQSILNASEDRIAAYLGVSFIDDFASELPEPVAQGIKMLAYILYDAADTIEDNRLPSSVRMMVDPFRVIS